MSATIYDLLIISMVFLFIIYILATCVAYFFDDLYPPTPGQLAKIQAKALIKKVNMQLFFSRVRKTFKRRNHNG